jgi:hypothetical protein
MNSSASVELRYEKCLLIWGNAKVWVGGHVVPCVQGTVNL